LLVLGLDELIKIVVEIPNDKKEEILNVCNRILLNISKDNLFIK
ncbi:MAG: hypothetical protein ACI8Q1_002213, partial [Parvicella sp.]